MREKLNIKRRCANIFNMCAARLRREHKSSLCKPLGRNAKLKKLPYREVSSGNSFFLREYGYFAEPQNDNMAHQI